MREYEVGSPATPNVVILSESTMVEVVNDTISVGRRAAIAKRGHPGIFSVWQVMDGLVCEYRIEGKELGLVRWPVWAHRVRILLIRQQASKERT